MATSRDELTRPGLLKGLGLLDSTTLVIGSMIGSGIFIVAADIARQVRSPGLLIMTWVVTAALTLTAALSYGELAAAFPQAGGQYVYLREAFGPLSGFLYGWTLFLVIQTGTLAAVAVAFAKFLGVFAPWVSAQTVLLRLGPLGVSSQQLVAIAVLALLTWVNTRGVRTGAQVQNVFTFAKVGALLGLVFLGLALGSNPSAVARNFGGFWENADWTFGTIRLVGVAMVGALFASDAWNNVTFAAGEIRNPRRNVPLALALGVTIVSAIYISCNLVYLKVLPLEAIGAAAEDRVATAAAQVILGPVAVQVMAAAIMISTFGCLNGMILAGARVYYAMALDGLFFRPVARLNPLRRTPVVSLVVQCAWACLLTLSGTYSDLLDYVIFAVLLFYILTIAGVFVLRRTRPGLERPYRAFGYPVLPALYIAAAGLIEVLLLLYKPKYTWPGLIIVLLGVPVYYFWRRRSRPAGA
ncbi:MAG: amino acid permease [Bryobacteraceae bacterium]|jgi:APA family basic amino acid/polyamine antiporter